MEEWKEVYGFDTLYEISNKGRLRTKRHGARGYQSEYRYIEPRENNNGYLTFNLKRNHVQTTVFVHRLVASAFVENPNKWDEVNHKDEDKHNNDASNLEYYNHLYNCNYGLRNKKTAGKNSKKIICIETGVTYQSATQAAEKMGISKTAINNFLHGRSNTCAGYTWRYADV